MGFSGCRYNTKKIAEELGIDEGKLVKVMNANAYGCFATVWSIEDKGTYSNVRMSISRRDKTTEQYEIEFQDGYVKFIGTAHEKIKSAQIPEKKGLLIKILSCDMTNFYKKPDGTVSYTPHYSVFAFDFFENNQNAASGAVATSKKPKAEDFMNIPEDTDDEELPFN